MSTEPKLKVLTEQFRGQEYLLTADSYAIGRSADVDIRIADSSVSGVHCELVRQADGGYLVVDDGWSRNGTRIAGTLVNRERLHDGDMLQLGMVECLYEDTRDKSSTTSTQTQIDMQSDAVEMNDIHGAGPAWDRDQGKGKAPTVMKFVITGLTVLVLVLSAILAWHIYLRI